MSTTPLFTGEIVICESPYQGNSIQCSEEIIPQLQKYLVAAGFEFDQSEILIPSTSEGLNWCSFGVSDGDFDLLIDGISKRVVGDGATVESELIKDIDDQYMRLNVTNLRLVGD